MPTEQIIQYIFLLLPGIISVKIYRVFCPTKKESDLFEFANSVFQSVLIICIYIYIFNKTVDSILSIKSFKIWELLILLSLSCLWGFLLVFIRHLRHMLANKFNALKIVRPNNYSVWERINHESKSEWAIVYLNDNSIYRGYFSLVTYDPDEDKEDALLAKATRVDEKLHKIYDIKGKGLYIKLKNVIKIEFYE